MTDMHREAFEREFSKPPFEWTFGRYSEHQAWPGAYMSYDVECAWEGYQAAIRHLTEQNEQRDRHE